MSRFCSTTAAKVGMDVARLKADMQRPEVTVALQDSAALAHKSGIDGTPTFILNGQVFPGLIDEATLAQEMKG